MMRRIIKVEWGELKALTGMGGPQGSRTGPIATHLGLEVPKERAGGILGNAKTLKKWSEREDCENRLWPVFVLRFASDRAFGPPKRPCRAFCRTSNSVWAEKMVGERGFEPPAPTSRT